MQAIDRIFSMLNTISAHPDGLSLSEISQAVGLAKSTTSRFLQSLEDVNAVHKKENKYSIGLGIVSLAASVPNSTIIQALAYPTLLELADKSKETVHLGIREGRNLTYIEQINTPHRVQLNTWLNQSYPLHVTAAGKVFLAHMQQSFLKDYLRQPLEAFSSNSITDPKALEQELQKIKAQGYAQTKREFSDDISGFAIGIFNATETPVACISISGPDFRFPEEDGDVIISLLKDASKQLSQKLRKEETVASD